MATTTLTPRARALRSSVTKKVLMAATGLIMVGYLVAHMAGNLKVFLGADEFNHYAEWLKGDILAPILPSGWFIWIFRVVMLTAIVLHAWSAWQLASVARVARGSKYINGKKIQVSYAARTMRWGGVILAVGLVFHILQFTAQVVQTGFRSGAAPYDMFILSFQQWWLVLLYAIWMVTVTLHIRHGFWSAFATLGLNTSAKARGLLNGLAYTVAALLFVGFLIAPVAVLIGVVN